MSCGSSCRQRFASIKYLLDANKRLHSFMRIGDASSEAAKDAASAILALPAAVQCARTQTVADNNSNKTDLQKECHV